MANFSLTSGEQNLPQDILDTLQKQIEARLPPETISSLLGIDIEQVRRLLANHPKLLAMLVETIKEQSHRFRCAQSNRLMLSPVLAADGNYYDNCILEAHPSLSSMPHPKLKAELAEFSKNSLEALKHCLHQEEPQQGVYELAAECLSVLSLESDLESVLKVLSVVKGKE
jgi:hypothetical protein